MPVKMSTSIRMAIFVQGAVIALISFALLFFNPPVLTKNIFSGFLVGYTFAFAPYILIAILYSKKE